VLIATPSTTEYTGARHVIHRTLYPVLASSSTTWCTGARHIIHHMVDRCSPRHPSTGVPVLATSSTAQCTGCRHAIHHTLPFLSARATRNHRRRPLPAWSLSVVHRPHQMLDYPQLTPLRANTCPGHDVCTGPRHECAHKRVVVFMTLYFQTQVNSKLKAVHTVRLNQGGYVRCRAHGNETLVP